LAARGGQLRSKSTPRDFSFLGKKKVWALQIYNVAIIVSY